MQASEMCIRDSTWTLYKKGATNRWYFGEKDIEKGEKEKVGKKDDFNFFLF